MDKNYSGNEEIENKGSSGLITPPQGESVPANDKDSSGKEAILEKEKAFEGAVPLLHKQSSPSNIRVAIITVSSTRDIADDITGNLIKEMAKEHVIVSHTVIKDNLGLIKNEIRELILNNFNPVDVIILNGGTGIARKDVTIESVRPLFEKELVSFNNLFACLSYNEIGSASLLSRAAAGISRGKVIFCLPGSPDACRLAMEKLIMPEIGHIMKHLGD